MKAGELKRGMVIAIEGENYLVRDVQVQTASSRSGNTLYKIGFRHVVTKQKLDRSFKGDDSVQPVDFMRRPVQLLFRETESSTFMDSETYEQFTLDNETLESELPYLIDGIEGVYALVADDMILGIELPATMIMEIVETAPGLKGASASARTKPATLSSGLVVQIPEYLATGDRIKVNTTTGEYMSRA